MISIIIPVYNTEKYLCSCLDSILRSEYKDFEIILVNDGSDDRSPQICRKYSRRNRCIKLFDQKHQGVSAARNRGLKECSGEWVIFVDSDDMISSDFLGMVGKSKYQEQDLLIFDSDKLSGMAEGMQIKGCVDIKAQYFNKKENVFLIDRLLNAGQITENGNVNLFSPCAKAYKRTVIENYSIYFSEDIMIGEDRLFNIEYLMCIQSCVYIPKMIYYIRIRSDSTMRSFHLHYMQNDLKYQRKLVMLLKEYGILSDVKSAYYNSVLSNITDILVRGIFSPDSKRTRRENYEMCRRLLYYKIYKRALEHSRGLGIIPRRILFVFLRMEWYGVVEVICKLSYILLKRMGRL